MVKNKNIKTEKSELESQYKKLFGPTNKKTKEQPMKFIQPVHSEEFITWVTYGAFEDPIR